MLKLTVFFLFLTSLPAFSSDQSGSDQELSLKQDREHLEKLRKEIPEDIKRENDDLAFILKLFEDKSRHPSKIRREFNRVYNRLRKEKRKEFKKQRDSYTKAEKKKRKKFLADAKSKRKAFLEGDPSSDKKKEFFDEERTDRKEFFSEERENRRDFESDLRAKRKQSDDFLKDKKRDFTERLRQFEKEQKALREQERQAKLRAARPQSLAVEAELTPKNQEFLKDFDKIPKRGGVKLAPPPEK